MQEKALNYIFVCLSLVVLVGCNNLSPNQGVRLDMSSNKIFYRVIDIRSEKVTWSGDHLPQKLLDNLKVENLMPALLPKEAIVKTSTSEIRVPLNKWTRIHTDSREEVEMWYGQEMPASTQKSSTEP